MANSTRVSPPVKASSSAPLTTRGLGRQQAKMRRKRDAVRTGALVIGIDLARERQAISFLTGGDVFGRRRVSCEPQHLAEILDEAEALAGKHQASTIVAAFEPAGHYWCLAAEAFERAAVPYVLVQPLSVKRAREESRYTPGKRTRATPSR